MLHHIYGTGVRLGVMIVYHSQYTDNSLLCMSFVIPGFCLLQKYRSLEKRTFWQLGPSHTIFCVTESMIITINEAAVSTYILYICAWNGARHSDKDYLMKTSWHGNTFCITGLLRGIHWSLKDASQFGSLMRSIGVFLLASLHKLLHKWSSLQWFETPWRSVMHGRDHLTKACHCWGTQWASDLFFK